MGSRYTVVCKWMSLTAFLYLGSSWSASRPNILYSDSLVMYLTVLTLFSVLITYSVLGFTANSFTCPLASAVNVCMSFLLHGYKITLEKSNLTSPLLKLDPTPQLLSYTIEFVQFSAFIWAQEVHGPTRFKIK